MTDWDNWQCPCDMCNGRVEDPRTYDEPDDYRDPCTCTVACIPQSITEDQYCRERRSAESPGYMDDDYDDEIVSQDNDDS